MKAPYKKTGAAVILDRFSGLLALGIILSIYGTIVLDNKIYDAVLIAGSVVAIIVLYFVERYLFKDFLPGFWPTFFLGSGSSNFPGSLFVLRIKQLAHSFTPI